MTYSYLSTFKSLKTGKLSVKIVGQPESHLMDWRGCNFKCLALPPEMRGGKFQTTEDAERHRKRLAQEVKDKTTIGQNILAYARSHSGSGFDEREMV